MPGKEGERGDWGSGTQEGRRNGESKQVGYVVGIQKRRTEDLEELGEKSGI